MSRDPLASVTRSPYGYVDNDPLNDTDPTGLCSVNPFSKKSCLKTAENARDQVQRTGH